MINEKERNDLLELMDKEIPKEVKKSIEYEKGYNNLCECLYIKETATITTIFEDGLTARCSTQVLVNFNHSCNG